MPIADQQLLNQALIEKKLKPAVQPKVDIDS